MDQGDSIGNHTDKNVWCIGFVRAVVCHDGLCASPTYIDMTCGKMPSETLLDREVAIQCQQFRQDEAATAVYNEANLLLKSYRACLEMYEQAPARAREYCGEYGKVLRNIGLQIKEPLDTDPSAKNAA